jgi:hypothetical protein
VFLSLASLFVGSKEATMMLVVSAVIRPELLLMLFMGSEIGTAVFSNASAGAGRWDF